MLLRVCEVYVETHLLVFSCQRSVVSDQLRLGNRNYQHVVLFVSYFTI